MSIRNFVYLSALSALLVSCQKEEMSNIPQIGLIGFGPEYMRINRDTVFMQFSMTDGDADLGVDIGADKYDIYIRDFRYDSSFTGYYFPEIDRNIEDPTKGLRGLCTFMFTPFILTPRPDTLHITQGDTTYFEVFIKDRAGNASNHFITPRVIMIP